MEVHDLKCWPESFDPVVAGIKTFELRYNDRNYQVGDLLHLMEWVPSQKRADSVGAGAYTGREVTKRICYILHGMGSVGVVPPFKGLQNRFCILGLMDTRWLTHPSVTHPDATNTVEEPNP